MKPKPKVTLKDSRRAMRQKAGVALQFRLDGTRTRPLASALQPLSHGLPRACRFKVFDFNEADANAGRATSDTAL